MTLECRQWVCSCFSENRENWQCHARVDDATWYVGKLGRRSWKRRWSKISVVWGKNI